MRKLYNHNKGKIYPSPLPSTTTADHLSLLPFTIAVLAATLPPEDKEVLAYLLSCSLTTNNSNNKVNNKNISNKIGGGGGSHPPEFNCNCFSCYTSYWVRWDASSNRQLIHEIIDAYEDGLIYNKKNGKNKKDRKKNKISQHPPPTVTEVVSHAPPQVEENKININGNVNDDGCDKGSVRKFVNFIGGRIWGVWGI